MIKYIEGTVFNQNVDAIVNTINVVGVMGAGLALEFSLRYPDMFEDYKKKCKSKAITLGKVDYYKAADVTIVNFPTKGHFKYPSKIEWIDAALKDFVSTYKSMNIKSVAFPRLGTTNGGLDWKDVQLVMEKHLSKIDIPVLICLDTAQAEGLEKKMVDKFNSTDFTSLSLSLKLNQKQREALENAKPIKRFWKIKDLDGIGIVCYTKLFEYCKENATASNVQMSLFD